MKLGHLIYVYSILSYGLGRGFTWADPILGDLHHIQHHHLRMPYMMTICAIELTQMPPFSTTTINSIPKAAVGVAGFSLIQSPPFPFPALWPSLGNIFQLTLI